MNNQADWIREQDRIILKEVPWVECNEQGGWKLFQFFKYGRKFGWLGSLLLEFCSLDAILFLALIYLQKVVFGINENTYIALKEHCKK